MPLEFGLLDIEKRKLEGKYLTTESPVFVYHKLVTGLGKIGLYLSLVDLSQKSKAIQGPRVAEQCDSEYLCQFYINSWYLKTAGI